MAGAQVMGKGARNRAIRRYAAATAAAEGQPREARPLARFLRRQRWRLGPFPARLRVEYGDKVTQQEEGR